MICKYNCFLTIIYCFGSQVIKKDDFTFKEAKETFQKLK